MTKEEIKTQMFEDLISIGLKIKHLLDVENPNIKQMADLHRYSETRLFIANSIQAIEMTDVNDS